jgi:hypothetical protein
MAKPGVPLLSAALLASLLVQCTNAPRLTSIAIIPDAPTVSQVGETVQFKAIGSYSRAGTHPTLTKDVTAQAAWLSSTVGVATINSAGLATAVDNGTTTITATITAPLGSIVGTATLEFVPLPAARRLTSLLVVPGKQATGFAGHFTQMMAIGIYNTEPRIQDVTTQVHWDTSDARIATIDSAGRAMGNNSGAATITASAKSRTGATITASTLLTQLSDDNAGPFRTLTIFDAGEGSGTIVSDPPGINCTAGNNGCSAEFAPGTTVTLIATPATHSTFSGWSANCLPNTAPTCTLVVNNNEPVGIIFH